MNLTSGASKRLITHTVNHTQKPTACHFVIILVSKGTYASDSTGVSILARNKFPFLITYILSETVT